MDRTDGQFLSDPHAHSAYQALKALRFPECPPQAASAHLAQRLALVEQRVRRAVDRRHRSDPDTADSLRGLYLSEETVARLLDPTPQESVVTEDAGPLAEVETRADEAELRGARLPLRAMARSFRLDEIEVELLLTVLAPDLDPRYERLYAYLNDDVTRRRATIGLTLELLRADPFQAAARARFAAGSPLVEGGLLLVEETDRPFLSRSLRVPDRVAGYLLGGEALDPQASAVLRRLSPAGGGGDPPVEGLATALRNGTRLAYLRELPGAAAAEAACAALERAGLAALTLDLGALATGPSPESLLPILAREARFCGAGLVVGRIDVLDPTGRPEHIRLLRSLAGLPVPVVFTGRRGWDPLWSDEIPLALTVPGLDVAGRAAVWREALSDKLPAADNADADASTNTKASSAVANANSSKTPTPPASTAISLLAPYVLAPEQIWRAAGAAHALALVDGVAVADSHLRAAVRAQNAAGLDRLARRVEPAVGWDDLVLPPTVVEELVELAARARHRDRVLGAWGMRPGGGRGRGVTALLAGDSGTGKTMSAEVIAGELGLDLYVVDLSTVVDKYIGETEKNLERIFSEAGGANGVLLFDEADAIFGKRSEVRDAHDRYANTESAYLLQRMESFDGIAVLTTNLQANLDEAFIRRLDAVVEFPMPDTASRRALWDRCLGTEVPRADDLDLDSCARFELSGGAIRACAVTAAYRVARSGRAVSTTDLVDAVRREYRKLGRLVLDHEFGPPG